MTPNLCSILTRNYSLKKPLTIAISLAISSTAMATNTYNTDTTLIGDLNTDVLLNTPTGNALTLNTVDYDITPTTNSAVTVASTKQVLINVGADSVLTGSTGFSAIQTQGSASDAITINNAGTLLGNGTAAILGAPTATGLLSVSNLSGGVIGNPTDYNRTTIASGSVLSYAQNYGSTLTGGIVGSNLTNDRVHLHAGDFSGHEISQVEKIFLGQSATAGQDLRIRRKVTVHNGTQKSDVSLMGGELFLAGASGNPALESFIDSGRIHLSNGNFHSFGASKIIFELSPNDSDEARIKVAGSGNSINLHTDTKLKIIPTNGTFSSGILDKALVLFSVTDGAQVTGWLADENSTEHSTNWEISPLISSQANFQKAVEVNNGVAVRFQAKNSGGDNGGSGGSGGNNGNPDISGSKKLQNLATSGGANTADVKALGEAASLAEAIIGKNGANVSQQEANFTTVIASATNEASARRLAQELQANSNSANLLAANTAQQSAIKNVTDRIQAVRLADNRAELWELAFASTDSSASTLTDAAVSKPLYGQQGLWIEGLHVSAKQKNSSAQLGYSAGANGLSIGYDSQIDDSLFIGSAITYGTTKADINNSLDTSDIDTYQLSFYGSYQGQTASGKEWVTDAVLNLGANKHSTKRYLDGFRDQAHNGRFDSQHVGLKVVSSIGFEHQNWAIAPSIGFNYARVALDGYQETTGPTPLNVRGQSIEQVELGVGISARRSFDTQIGKLQPYAGVMAWHDFNNQAVNTTSSFQLGGNSFTSADLKQNSSRVQVNLGTSLKVNDQTHLGLSFEHNNNGSLKSNQWNLALRYEF